MNATLRAFITPILNNLPQDREITDIFFNVVQNNTRYKTRYDELCGIYKPMKVNQKIGRLIKELRHLPNTGRKKATSKLIKTYTRH